MKPFRWWHLTQETFIKTWAVACSCIDWKKNYFPVSNKNSCKKYGIGGNQFCLLIVTFHTVKKSFLAPLLPPQIKIDSCGGCIIMMLQKKLYKTFLFCCFDITLYRTNIYIITLTKNCNNCFWDQSFPIHVSMHTMIYWLEKSNFDGFHCSFIFPAKLKGHIKKLCICILHANSETFLRYFSILQEKQVFHLSFLLTVHVL